MLQDQTKIVTRITVAIACIISIDMIMMLLASFSASADLGFVTAWHAGSQFINIILAVLIIKRGEGRCIALATMFMIISVAVLLLMGANMVTGLSLN